MTIVGLRSVKLTTPASTFEIPVLARGRVWTRPRCTSLKRLKQAVADLRAGGSAENYLNAVEEVAVVVHSALELYTSPYMQDRIAKMESGPAQIYKEMARAAQEMASALEQMETIAEAETGLKRFEAGLWKIDAIQDRTIAKATQLAEAGEA